MISGNNLLLRRPGKLFENYFTACTRDPIRNLIIVYFSKQEPRNLPPDLTHADSRAEGMWQVVGSGVMAAAGQIL